jgi:hypothetical protein
MAHLAVKRSYKACLAGEDANAKIPQSGYVGLYT